MHLKCLKTEQQIACAQQKQIKFCHNQKQIFAQETKMQSPIHRQDESNTNESAEPEKMCPLESASATATPSKKVKFLESAASAGIKKAVTKRGTRNQSFRNNRVRVANCNQLRVCLISSERAFAIMKKMLI